MVYQSPSNIILFICPRLSFQNARLCSKKQVSLVLRDGMYGSNFCIAHFDCDLVEHMCLLLAETVVQPAHYEFFVCLIE